VEGRTVWEAVLEYLRESEPVSGARVLARFKYDDTEIVSGVLGDLSNSGLVYRAGRGDAAVYRIASEDDFEDDARERSNEYVVWLVTYRNGPIGVSGIAERSLLSEDSCRTALDALVESGRVSQRRRGDEVTYESERFEALHGSRGWEAAVIDHFRAVVSAIGKKVGQAALRGESLAGGTSAGGGASGTLVFQDEWASCETADECVFSPAQQCCSCSLVAANVDFEEEARASIPPYDPQACVDLGCASEPCDPSPLPACVDGLCVAEPGCSRRTVEECTADGRCSLHRRSECPPLQGASLPDLCKGLRDPVCDQTSVPANPVCRVDPNTGLMVVFNDGCVPPSWTQECPVGACE